MKNIIVIIITLISLGFSINWMIKTNYENEPIIATLGIIIALIGYFVSQNVSNSSKIKGNSNIVNQTIDKTDKSETIKANRSKIDGDKNNVKQKSY